MRNRDMGRWWKRHFQNTEAVKRDAERLLKMHGTEAKELADNLARHLRRRNRSSAKHYAYVALWIDDILNGSDPAIDHKRQA